MSIIPTIFTKYWVSATRISRCDRLTEWNLAPQSLTQQESPAWQAAIYRKLGESGTSLRGNRDQSVRGASPRCGSFLHGVDISPGHRVTRQSDQSGLDQTGQHKPAEWELRSSSRQPGSDRCIYSSRIYLHTNILRFSWDSLSKRRPCESAAWLECFHNWECSLKGPKLTQIGSTRT